MANGGGPHPGTKKKASTRKGHSKARAGKQTKSAAAKVAKAGAGR